MGLSSFSLLRAAPYYWPLSPQFADVSFQLGLAWGAVQGWWAWIYYSQVICTSMFLILFIKNAVQPAFTVQKCKLSRWSLRTGDRTRCVNLYFLMILTTWVPSLGTHMSEGKKWLPKVVQLPSDFTHTHASARAHTHTHFSLRHKSINEKEKTESSMHAY